MAGDEPEERVRQPVLRQSWRELSLLHWRIDADRIAARLPTGLSPDLVDGSAWVALVPFVVRDFRVLSSPLGSCFPETNVRTYVRHRDGRDGLWFFSLDVTNTLNVLGGRVVQLPYHRASMTVAVADGSVRYRCRRRLAPRVHHDIVVRPGNPLGNGSDAALARLLAGRWRAFWTMAGNLVDIPVEHEPWPLRQAELVSLDETLLRAVGLAPGAGDPLVHFSEGVHARFGMPRRLGRA